MESAKMIAPMFCLTTVLAMILAWNEHTHLSQLRERLALLAQAAADLAENNQKVKPELEPPGKPASPAPAVAKMKSAVETPAPRQNNPGTPEQDFVPRRFAESPAQVTALVRRRYENFFKSQKFEPGQIAAITDLLRERQQSALDAVNLALGQGLKDKENLPAIRKAVLDARQEVEAQMESEFGKQAMQALRHYDETTPQRNTIDAFKNILQNVDERITDDQARRLIEVLARTQEPDDGGGVGRIVYGSVNDHSKLTPATITAAASILSPVQLEALKGMLQQQNAARNER